MGFTVVLADDHAVVREAIRSILSGRPEYHVAGEAASGIQAVSLCRQLEPDIVLMDISLPEMSGIEATAEVVRHCPKTAVVILSMHADEQSMMSAIRVGARAYVPKSCSSRELLDTLRAVTAGGAYFSWRVSKWLLRSLQKDRTGKYKPDPTVALTAREAQVFRFIAEGKASKEIAQLLKLQTDTIRTYRKKMMRKLGIHNSAEVTRLAVSIGLLNSAVASPPR